MNTYKMQVRVPSPSRQGMVTVWAQIVASGPIQARQLLEAQYGRGNVVGVAVLA